MEPFTRGNEGEKEAGKGKSKKSGSAPHQLIVQRLASEPDNKPNVNFILILYPAVFYVYFFYFLLLFVL